MTGRLTTVTYPSGVSLKYDYDSTGRINRLSIAPNAYSSYTTLLDTIGYPPFGPAHSYRLTAVAGTPTLSRSLNSDNRIDRYTLSDTVKAR